MCLKEDRDYPIDLKVRMNKYTPYVCRKRMETIYLLTQIVIQSEAKNLDDIHVDVFEILRYTPFRSE